MVTERQADTPRDLSRTLANVTAMHELRTLGDEEYYRFVTKRLHPNYDHLWHTHLLAPDLVDRTRRVLVAAKELVATGSTADKARLAELRTARDAGRLSPEEFKLAKAPLDVKRGRRIKFLQLVEVRMRQVKGVAQSLKRAAHQAHQARNRDQARGVAQRLALAVYRHRAAILACGDTPTEQDLALWEHLARERLPFGGHEMALNDAIDSGIWGPRHAAPGGSIPDQAPAEPAETSATERHG